MNAAEILNPSHPLHALFLRFLGGKEATKRQARKFLAAYPQYRVVQQA